MKQLATLFIIALLLTACNKNYSDTVDTCTLSITLAYPEDVVNAAKDGVRVELKSIGREAIFADATDAEGTAHFTITPGIYEATSSAKILSGNNTITILNGTSGQIIVGSEPSASATISMQGSRVSQLVIKEFYNGGVLKDDGKNYQYDKSFIIYNNSSVTASFPQLCVGFMAPYNSQANNYWYGSDGRLVYEAEGYLPMLDGIWYFPTQLDIEPYSQAVICCNGAIDHTITYPQSVNYANPDYYCMYDPATGYNNVNYYPTPSELIPQSHYLKAVKMGISNAWPLSVTSPALVLFQIEGTTPQAYGTDVQNMVYIPGAAQSDINKCLKVPVSWVIDAIEVFSAAHATTNQKRLTATVDAGYVGLTNQHGHTLYRNVDKEATEALPENKGKLVYGYTMGVDGSTDPSDIDAEASLKNGAHIVYQDTNNSTNDFHERQQCSLRN